MLNRMIEQKQLENVENFKYLGSIVMFVPCITRRRRNNQHYALIYTTPLFYIPAPTCFGNSLPKHVGACI
jgi:hypothetical protein